MSYLRANEFTLQIETIKFIYDQAPKMGYSEEQTEDLLASFDSNFLKEMREKATESEAWQKIYEDLDAFIKGEAFGYNLHFCLLRFNR